MSIMNYEYSLTVLSIIGYLPEKIQIEIQKDNVI